MNVEQTHELMFIIAKYLKTLFPDVAEAFIQRCESENLFPKPVFSQSATFDELQTSFLAGVPDDQLIRIISHVQNNSKFSSLLASLQQSSNNSSNRLETSNGDIDPKFFNDLICDSLRNQINPLETVIPPFHRFGPRQQIISHTDKIYCLAVDITSQVLITGSDDFLVKIWKIPEMIPMKMFDVHIDSITDLQIHPNNLYFCSSSHDSTITVFTFLDGGRVVIKLKMNNMVHSIKFSSCGTFLGAASQEGCVSIWNFNEIIEYDKSSQNSDKLKRPKYFSIEPIKIIYSPKKRPAAWLSFSPNGNFVAFACDPNLVIVSSLNENYSVQLRGHSESPDFVFFSKITCNKILSLSCRERGVRLWESQNDIWDKSILLTNTRKVRLYQATFNCDESRIVGVSTKMITVWDTESKQQLFLLTHNEYTDHATIIAAHPTIPAVVFVSTSKGRTSLWDIINGQLICGLQSEERMEILEAIWSPDGQYIFTSDSIGGVTIYIADPKNRNRKVSDLVPYTEMFFLNEIIEAQEKEDRQSGSGVKENTFKDKSIFNQAYYRKVNNKNYEADTLITDRIKNPLLPQPKRWFLSDLRLQVAPQQTMDFDSQVDDEESIALNLMKALFTAAKSKKGSSDMNDVSIDESTVVPILNTEKNRKDQSDDENQDKDDFNDSDDGYETSFDGENIQRRRKKSRKEAEREREERLQRRNRKLEESRNDSGFSSESTIASRRTRRRRNEPKRKNLSRSSSSSTTNLLRKKSSRIKLNELSASNSSTGNSEDQEYEMDPLNEYEDDIEEYEDEIEFEKEIEEEDEEEEEEKKEIQKKQTKKPTKNARHSVSPKANANKKTKANQQQKKSTPLNKIKKISKDSDYDEDNPQSDSSESSDLESTSVPVSAVSSSSLYRFLLPSWTFSVKRTIHTYIPQIGDEVVYLQKGHLDWKKECSFMHFTPPYQIRPDLPQVSEARISDIKFYVTHLVITLQFYSMKVGNLHSPSSKGKKKGRSSDSSFDEIIRKFALSSERERKILFEAKIAYPMPDSPQFIVKKSRFVYSMLNTLLLKPSNIVKVEFQAPEKSNSLKSSKSNQRLNEIDNDVQLFMGKVKSISSNWINDPWQCINVIFTDDNKPGKLQPWELIFDEEKIKKDLTASLQKNFDEDESDSIVIDDAKMKKMNDSLVHFVSEMLQIKENAPFVSIRTNDEQKILRRKSKFPVDLTLICDRLANRWYTSVDSLKYDVNLIKSNAQLFDELNDKVADRIVDQLMKKIEPFSMDNEKSKPKNRKSKKEVSDSETESELDDSETDSELDDSGSESDSDSKSTLTMKTRRSEKSFSQKKTSEKSSRVQSKNTKRTSAQPKSALKDDDSDSSSMLSSTTSASSSVTTTSSDSE